MMILANRARVEQSALLISIILHDESIIFVKAFLQYSFGILVQVAIIVRALAIFLMPEMMLTYIAKHRVKLLATSSTGISSIASIFLRNIVNENRRTCVRNRVLISVC